LDNHLDSVREHIDRYAPELARWRARNRYYHADHVRYLRHLVSPGKRVLELGSGNGELLAALQPGYGVGAELSPALVRQAQARHAGLEFVAADAASVELAEDAPFDYVILSDLVGYLDDVQACFERLHRWCGPKTRVVVSYYNLLWEPLLKLGELVRLKMPTPSQSWLSPDDVANLLVLSDFEVVKIERRLLCPVFVPLLSWLLNHLGAFPGINRACLTHYVVARPRPRPEVEPLSTTIVIPCRNERGNIEAAVHRMPRFGEGQEIIFVDGHSSDGTPDEIRRVIAAHPELDIKLMVQDGTGKGDAVRKAFEAARGDVLMILDADLTVPPEDLPKFYRAIASGKAEFLNGSRLVYPMEDQAMRSLNLLGNKFFAMAFSWLLGQRLKDTLCGTKVIRREAYRELAASRAYFGDFDPFGDFDLLFGASKLNLRIVEVPVRYRARVYGETNIRRFAHGLQLLRMVVFAYRKLKSGRGPRG
jgi:SAM-dependent methyltransferase